MNFLIRKYFLFALLVAISLLGFVGCGTNPDILVVRTDSLVYRTEAFDSVLLVSRISEDVLRNARHLFIQENKQQLSFSERNAMERYLQAGGYITFYCLDTIYNWGQITPYLKNGQLAFDCAEGVIMKKAKPDYHLTTIPEIPQFERLVKEVLVEPLKEPISMAITENSMVYWIERKGTINLFNPSTEHWEEISKLDVYHGHEDGLLGIALDPDFSANSWVYLFYSAPGDDAVQRVSRFNLSPKGLDLKSEKILIEIPVQREECCHSGGDLDFDAKGNLYISTGDNTFSRASDGFTPLDERPGRENFDSQRTSANTKDLRGKILRIHPEKDGSYTIPEGNLFSPNDSDGLPEIYIMGARNPFTIAVDEKGRLYWGDVGPDGNVSSERGPSAYDEINCAEESGNYGWPYFNADNLAYADYNFETGKLGQRFNPSKPVNESANNTGATFLPKAEPALVYYTFDETLMFPGVGKGSRSVGVGEVYNYQAARRHGYELPPYYDGKLFAFDWARDWVMLITQDKAGNFQSIEPFLDRKTLASPIDMKFGPDGALYILEYGIGYFTNNSDSRLIRITYQNGNRSPKAKIRLSSEHGSVPFNLKADAMESKDPDLKDRLTYEWQIAGPVTKQLESETINLTLEEKGEYEILLRVKDGHGGMGIDRKRVVVGNNAPDIDFEIYPNKTFYLPGKPIRYELKLSDVEDGAIGSGIPQDSVKIHSYKYKGSDNRAPMILGQKSELKPEGLQLIETSDCYSCHKIDKKSIGPSFKQVAARYQKDYLGQDLIARKIIEGGSGVWGDGMMVGHPDLSQDQAQSIVTYIMSTIDAPVSEKAAIPWKGEIATSQDKSIYRLESEYRDRGVDGKLRITSNKEYTLLPPVLEAEQADSLYGFSLKGSIADGDLRWVLIYGSNSYLKYNHIDLTSVTSIKANLVYEAERFRRGDLTLEIRKGGVDGELIGETYAHLGLSQVDQIEVKVNEKGMHDLYMVVRSEYADLRFGLDRFQFQLEYK